ncbi:oligosaccharide flippase family protein [Aestuariimicrobium ganziense]|uniref:oligosaccharide flippase family protein n=1 Tax=Aestuariimicrobium ganziense TaxID=2773677 RepID=UPI002E2B79BA|nr:oligosaccharide flippase family protein [Aestuariimicrobium ganziense]
MNEPRQRSIGASARGGARSSILAQMTVQVGSALATIALARLLAPDEFGVIALAQSLVGAASLLGLSGITASIVTSAADVERKAATYFWVGLLAGLGMGGAIAVASPQLVAALGQPGAAPYVMVLAVTVPLSLTTLVPQALLQRRLQFNRMNSVTVVGAVVYFVLEVLLALLGLGAWAVIWGQVAGAGASLIVSLALARWIPRHRPRFAEVREDVALVSSMGLNSVFGYLGKNADYWVVSRVMGPAQLGVYYIAYVLPSIVRVRISGIFRQVMLPILAGIEQFEDQASAWRRATLSSFALALPAMFGIAAVAAPLIKLLFGAQWSGAADPMRLVTLAGVTDLAIHAVSTMAIARKRLIFRATLLVGMRALLVAVGALVAAWAFRSLMAVALAVLVASLITLLVQEFTVARPLGIGVRTLGRDLFGILVVCGVMFGGVHLVINTLTPGLPPVLQLAAGVATGIVLYLSVGWVVARRAVRESGAQLARLARGK